MSATNDLIPTPVNKDEITNVTHQLDNTTKMKALHPLMGHSPTFPVHRSPSAGLTQYSCIIQVHLVKKNTIHDLLLLYPDLKSNFVSMCCALKECQCMHMLYCTVQLNTM